MSKMLSKTVHLRPLKSQNYIRVRTPERAARIHERNAISELNHEYKPILKTSYDGAIFKFQKERIAKLPQPSDYKPSVISKTGDDYESTHYAGYLVHKKKKYNGQLKTINNVPISKLISKEEYEAIRSSSVEFSPTQAAERGEEADKRNVYRKNLFVSKPFTDINKDFKFQPLIRNAQTSSEDTPYWFQGTAKYYTSENFDLTKNNRSKLNNLPKADIFGKNLVEYPKQENLFMAQPPSKAHVPHARLRWEESPEKQSYDRARLTWKIGNNADPFIKTVREKASFDPLVAYKKIGEEKDAARLKKEKNLDLKIGHPNDMYSYTKKGRDDGFYGNRKEITGENYRRSTFFVS